jgi:thiamine pyrophosphate-dependent acetolactate synthase large subunit-like protein
METYAAVKGLDWSIVSQSGNVSNWLNRLWPIEQHHHWFGRSGGYGVGYGAPASVPWPPTHLRASLRHPTGPI